MDDDRMSRRRFIETGVLGVGALAAGHDLATATTPAMAATPVSDGERVVDAVISNRTLYVLVVDGTGRRVRTQGAVHRRGRHRLQEMPALPISGDFTATAFAAGARGLVGSLQSHRQRTFDARLHWELPSSLLHLAETTPTDREMTVTETVWEPAQMPALGDVAAHVAELRGTFGHVVAAGPGRAANGGRQMVVGLGAPGQLIADVTRVALIDRGAVLSESSVGHHESVVSACITGNQAIALIRRDDDDMAFSVDLAASAQPERQPVGIVPGDVSLAAWRSGIVLTAASDGDLRTWQLTKDRRWIDRPPSRPHAPRRLSEQDTAIPIDGTDDLVVIADGATLTVEDD